MKLRKITKQLIQQILSNNNTNIRLSCFNSYYFCNDVLNINRYLLTKLLNQLYEKKTKFNTKAHFNAIRKQDLNQEEERKQFIEKIQEQIPNELKNELDDLSDGNEFNDDENESMTLEEYCEKIKIKNIEKYIKILFNEEEIKDILDLSREEKPMESFMTNIKKDYTPFK